ncbi:MAG: peptidase M16 [endosymbiont of Galathealinum brachiosum]|uniref:Peptidase M16 n=1 Tax=endosymbiont of Galathealinum brachiosum TaxID=2200906 RepID=A0A370DHQ0_9GAMM|nr:MAG: peptidase M16 [endosymbiont of Galathealinum brachiosum]
MSSVDLKPAQVHPAFQWKRSERIDSLNITIEEYAHIKTGAAHYHLSADNNENVFLVALRTVPTDSTGVAHMLEHTALCGSERFPVRDPFFMMIRRSLNTFMNAFTSSDWTAYPFASQNRKDFDNLMDVYLDAVFFSRLHELDFAQEGHRFEFETPNDPESDLVYKGVVFNEMKGAMSSPVSTLWQTVTEHLFPTTTYHYNSGGEPENIPDLSYQQLKDFYKVHYHPSNSVFMTFGDIPAIQHHEVFEEKALSRFEKLDMQIKVDDETRYTEPHNFASSYAFDEEDTKGKTHIVISWLLGRSTSLQEMLQAHLMSSVLLDNSASPLQKALETTDLGASPSPLCGLEDSNLEMSFMCGLEASEAVHADAIEKLVLDVLEDVVNNGVDQSQVDAVLHQLELGQREIGGDGYPYGMQLILGGLSAAIHRGDPIAVMNLEPVLEQLREDIKDPDFIKNLVKKNLLDNQHRIRLIMTPDTNLSKAKEKAEADNLAEIKAKLSADEKQQIVEQAAALEKRQNEEDDISILPKVGLEDVPAKMQIPTGTSKSLGDLDATFFDQGTNGLIYQQIIIDLPDIDKELVNLLPLYTYCLTELGCGDKDYLQSQAWQDAVSGGVGSYTSVRGSIDNEQNIKAHFVFSGKALARNHQQLNELMSEMLENARFDELERIRELVSQKRARREQSVTGQGHSLAMTAASSGMSPAAELSHRLSGLQGIKQLKELDDSLDADDALKNLAEKFKNIHQHILSAPRKYLTIAEKDHQNELEKDIQTFWSGKGNSEQSEFNLPEVKHQVKQAWLTSTQVNFSAKSYPTVSVNHEDAAALSVLGGFLRNGFLHRVIREQGGAYGGGASHEPSNACFRFFSYRDPRLAETLNDFDKSIEWLLNEEHTELQVEESILGVIGSMDKPGSPAGEAKQAFHNELYGRTPAQRHLYRERVLKVTVEDLKRVGEKYLKPENASVAVVTNPANEETVKELGLEIHNL